MGKSKPARNFCFGDDLNFFEPVFISYITFSDLQSHRSKMKHVFRKGTLNQVQYDRLEVQKKEEFGLC